MTAHNRVTPTGAIVATPGRGAWMGNRGRLHENHSGRDIVRQYQTWAWLTCTLAFKGRWQAQWQPNHYTHLFFLDEAVALAAGHRPCALCRRSDYQAYQRGWAAARGGPLPNATEMDRQLHAERRTRADCTVALAVADWTSLPDGVFVAADGEIAVVVGEHLAVWDAQSYGYGARCSRPSTGIAPVLTPLSSVGVLRNGYPVQIDPAAR